MEFLADLHPKLVHFPIAFLTGYVLFEFIGVIIKKKVISQFAFIMLVLGVLGSLAALITGGQAEEAAEELLKASSVNYETIHEAIEDHEFWGGLTTWFFTILLVFRTLFWIYLEKRGKFPQYLNSAKYIFVILGITGSFFIYETGEHGGKLVYKHGVGTELVKPQTDQKPETEIKVENEED
ncbi:MAG: DUF2231 domain-containing protein [Ignavibacteriaceae bacterium]